VWALARAIVPEPLPLDARIYRKGLEKAHMSLRFFALK